MTTVNHSAASGVHPGAYAQSGDPGAVGAHILWVDTTSGPPYSLKKRNAGNSAWEAVGLAATVSGELTATDFKASGITGATAASRYVGATASGAPASGTFAVGDVIADQTGKFWMCTTAGTVGSGAVFAQIGAGASLYTAYIRAEDQKTSGTTGGTFTSGAWRTRVLNTKPDDTGSHAALASNQITLDAGTYRVAVNASAYQCDRHVVRLQNITDAATILSGQTSVAGVGETQSGHAFLSGRFTIAAAKVIEVQHQCQTTGTFGLAQGTIFAVGVEVYTTIELWKE